MASCWQRANHPEPDAPLSRQDRPRPRPGLGQSEQTLKLIHELLAGTHLPAVIDADALNLLASIAACLTSWVKPPATVAP